MACALKASTHTDGHTLYLNDRYQYSVCYTLQGYAASTTRQQEQRPAIYQNATRNERRFRTKGLA
jgi:hypothetical protein